MLFLAFRPHIFFTLKWLYIIYFVLGVGLFATNQSYFFLQIVFVAALAIVAAKEEAEKKQTKRGLLDLGYGISDSSIISGHSDLGSLGYGYGASLSLGSPILKTIAPAPIIKSYATLPAPAISYAAPAPIIKSAPILSAPISYAAPAPVYSKSLLSYAAPTQYLSKSVLSPLSYAAPSYSYSDQLPLSYSSSILSKGYAAPALSYAAPAISYGAPTLSYASSAPLLTKTISSYAAPAPIYAKSYGTPLSLGLGGSKLW